MLRAKSLFLTSFALLALFAGGMRAEAATANWKYYYNYPAGTLCNWVGGQDGYCNYTSYPAGSVPKGAFYASDDGTVGTNVIHSYVPGATIPITLVATDLASGNCSDFGLFGCQGNHGMSITATVGASSKFNNQSANWTVVKYLTAPTTPGTYPVNLVGGWYDTTNFINWSSFNIIVACPTGTAWNGSSCAVPPSGSISASPNPCTIAAGGNACSTTVSWSAANTPSVTVYAANANATPAFWSGGAGANSQVAPWVWYTTAANFLTFILKDANGNTLASAPVNGVCASGSIWNGSSCAPWVPYCTGKDTGATPPHPWQIWRYYLDSSGTPQGWSFVQNGTTSNACVPSCSNGGLDASKCPTGSWTSPTCPTACSTAASTQTGVCTGGNGYCAGTVPTLSCAATAACTCANGANNPTACTQCPANQAYVNGSCVACNNGGCTGNPGGNSSSPVGSLTCNNGASNPYLCTSFASCPLPWGGSIASGSTVSASLTATVPYGSTCSTETRSCTNGTLSGTYTYQTCTPNAPASCSAIIIGACDLGATASGGTSGGCHAGYTGSCTYSCSNGAWSKTSDLCSVLMPNINSFTVAPVRTYPNRSVVVAWSTTDVTSCSVTRNGVSWKTSASGSFSYPDTVTRQTKYTLTCDTLIPESVMVNMAPSFNEF